MNRLKYAIAAGFVLLTYAPYVRAQLSSVVVVDFERAVVESNEGKKASEKFNAALQARQADLEKRQRDIDEQNKKLQNGARTLSDAAKAEIQRDIDRKTTELQRINEDAQKDLGMLREELLRPIAERGTEQLNILATEKDYTLVIDVSDQNNNVIYAAKENQITDELIKRINAASPPEPAKPETVKPPAAGAGTNKPPADAGTKPATPPTTKKPE